MKSMRVVAQQNSIEEAMRALYSELASFLAKNPIYGTVYGHDGSTDMGILAPWGETESEMDLDAKSDFSPHGDDSFINLMFGSDPVGAVEAKQQADGTIEFLMDFHMGLLPVGTANIPIASVVKNIYDKLDEDEATKNERAADIAQDKQEEYEESRYEGDY